MYFFLNDGLTAIVDESGANAIDRKLVDNDRYYDERDGSIVWFCLDCGDHIIATLTPID